MSADNLRLSFDWKVFLRKPSRNIINAGLRVIECYCDFVSILIRIILHHTGDLLQGSTYPARCDRSLASRYNELDNSFSGKSRLGSNEQKDYAQNIDSSDAFTMLHKRTPPQYYSRLFNVSGMISESAGKICILSVIVVAFPPLATALTTSWIRMAASGPIM